jgi:hypothetical protein
MLIKSLKHLVSSTRLRRYVILGEEVDLMGLNLKISETILLERVIERVLDGIPESERTKEKLKELREQEPDLLSTIQLQRLDDRGLEIADQSKLFEE